MSNEEKRNKFLGIMTEALLQASGSDIRAPKGLREAAVEGLELQNDPEWIFINADLEQIKDPEKKLNIIRGLILTHLKPSDMMSLIKVVHVGVETTLKYLSIHPEERGKVMDPRELIDRLMGKKDKEDSQEDDNTPEDDE